MRARSAAAARRGRGARALVVLVAAIGSLAALIVPAAPAAGAASVTSLSSGFVDSGVESLGEGTEQPFDSAQLRVIGPPSIDGAGGPTLTAGRFTGRAVPGATVEVRSIGPGGATVHSCPAALPDGFWSCIIPVASGQYRVSARQALPALGPERSAWSTPTIATVDRDSPGAPTIEQPSTGTITTSPTVRAAGTGEPDAALQLFVDGDLVCETSVDAAGSWACDAPISGSGVRELRALQRDPAGNFSSASTGVRVERAAPGDGPDDPPGGGTGGSTTPGGGSTAPGSAGEPSETPGGSSGAPSPGDAGGDPGGDAGGDAGESDDGSASGATPDRPGQIGPPPDGTSNWGTPTGFGGSLPTAAQIVERDALVVAPLVAIGYLLLIALPLRGFATSVMPRIRLAVPRFTGRNRGFVAEEDGPVVAPALTAVGVFAGAAIVAAVQGGVDLELRYLRLTAAIGLGLLVLAGLGAMLPAGLVRRSARVPIVTRLLPGILVIAIGAALLTRVAELRPGILIGVLVAASVVGVARFRVRVTLAVAQLGAVAALALAGWAVHDALTPSTGFWVSFIAETAAAVALGGFGSLLVMLLPVGSFPGRAVYAVSRVVWGIAALAVASVTGAIVAAGSSFPLTELALAAAGVGAVLVGSTVWTRWVEPALP